MTGTIKFYNSEKGFGFIYSEEVENDIYFNISNWKNPSAPNINDDVDFETIEEKKGKIAVNIKIAKSSDETKMAAKNQNDERIECPCCGKKIVPRIITYRGKPQNSVCPYCAAEVRKFIDEKEHSFLKFISISLIIIALIAIFS